MYRQVGIWATWLYLIINQFMLGRELREMQDVLVKLHDKMKSSEAKFSTHQIQVWNNDSKI